MWRKVIGDLCDFRELLLPLRLEELQEKLLESIDKGWVGGLATRPYIGSV